MLSVAPTRRLSTLLACVALGVLAPSLAAPVDPARALAAPGDRCAQPGDTGSDIPWPHTMLALDSVWPFTRGGGTTVAVLSTGVDADQPRLRGHVLDGFDAMAGAGPADSDCTGTGTQVAGVIAAQAPIGNGGGVTAVAPATRILPVRVIADDPVGTAPAAPAALARGITWSAEHDADVIVVATPVYRGTDDLRDAVAGALTRGTVVVAAVGDLDGDGPATPYPAGYPGVLGVGAVGPDGLVWAKSRAGDFVDLVAPGVAVSTVQRGSGLVRVDGTAVAAGFVGGVAALVRAKRGNVLGSEGSVVPLFRARLRDHPNHRGHGQPRTARRKLRRGRGESVPGADRGDHGIECPGSARGRGCARADVRKRAAPPGSGPGRSGSGGRSTRPSDT